MDDSAKDYIAILRGHYERAAMRFHQLKENLKNRRQEAATMEADVALRGTELRAVRAKQEQPPLAEGGEANDAGLAEAEAAHADAVASLAAKQEHVAALEHKLNELRGLMKQAGHALAFVEEAEAGNAG